MLRGANYGQKIELYIHPCNRNDKQESYFFGMLQRHIRRIWCSHSSYRGILVYNICLISISNSVSDGATKKSVLNIERS